MQSCNHASFIILYTRNYIYKRSTIFIIYLSLAISLVGIVLDQTGSGSCSCYIGCHIVADLVDAACQVSSCFTSRFLFKGCRRLYVNMHNVSPINRHFRIIKRRKPNKQALVIIRFSWHGRQPIAGNKRFVFMALMEYCLVNIILGDSDAPKTAHEPPKPEKVFDLAAKVCLDINFTFFFWKNPDQSAITFSGKIYNTSSEIISLIWQCCEFFYLFFKCKYIIWFLIIKENARMLMGQPPRPPGPTPAQRARMRAIQVDRFSRFFFPFLFTVLNGSYWAIFASYL